MRIILLLMIFCIGFTSNPQYGDTQIKSIIEEYFTGENDSPNLLGIQIFKDKKDRACQLDIETNPSNRVTDMILSFRALARVGPYAKKPFQKFIVICHLPKPDVPSVAESQANCAVKHFVQGKITEQTWRQNCLIEKKL